MSLLLLSDSPVNHMLFPVFRKQQVEEQHVDEIKFCCLCNAYVAS